MLALLYHPGVPLNVLTAIQAAEKLGISRRRVLALIISGRLPAERVGNQYVIKPKDLEKVRERKPGRPRKDGK